MSEIQTNQEGIKNVSNLSFGIKNLEQRSMPRVVQPRNTVTYDEYWRREKRKNSGLIERLYNGIKNLTGLGTGSKKIEKSLSELKSGKISQKEFSDKVHSYQSSQENSAQIFGDLVSVGAGLLVFKRLFKTAKMQGSKIKLNPLLEKELIGKNKTNYLIKIITGIGKSNTKTICVAAGASAMAAGFAKLITMKLNRTGSDEYKLDKNLYNKKSSIGKRQKRALNKERRRTNFKNFVSGTINGLMMPVMALGGVIGAPLYLIGNSLNRYFVANKTDKNKSAGSYISNITNDGVSVGLTTAAMAVPLFKKGNFLRVFNKNINKVTKKLKNAELKKPDFLNISAYSELESIMLNSENISKIINNPRMLPEEQIKKLTEENIFAVKFKQISADQSQLTNALREKCPATRTLEEAQSFINKRLGNGYDVKQLLGAGTIAETYLAKSPDGKEVCLKVLKNGISEEKILSDKAKFVSMIKNHKHKTDEEKKYLLRNIDDLAEGILKEVNFQNEMEAAKSLAPHTKVANVVKPIEVKNGIYIMEKAEGISLASLVDLNEAKLYRNLLSKSKTHVSESDFYQIKKNSKLYFELEGKKTPQEKIDAIDKYIRLIESRTPQFKDISLNKDDANYLLKEYMKVLVEQFNKVEKDGKVIHADIHPGNIFIDMNALKSRKGKIFTLIDTGNTIKQTQEQTMRAIHLTSFVKRGDVPDIAEYVLEGAILPKGLTHDDAVEKISYELKKCFFDDKTALDTVNNDSILTLSANIMRKYGIIPSDTQLNLNKAKKSANNSLSNMAETLFKISMQNVDGNASAINAIGGLFKDIFMIIRKYKSLISAQEKQNLRLLPMKEQIKYKNNPNLLATNSEDYLTYILKPYKHDA